MGGSRPAAVLKIIPHWLWGGGGQIPEACLLLPDLHRPPIPPRGEEEEGLGCMAQPLVRGCEHPSSIAQTGSAVKLPPESRIHRTFT